MSAEYKDNVGKRLLIEWGISGVIEVLVLEVSPSGNLVKIQAPNHTEWVRTYKHDIIEVLPDTPAAMLAERERRGGG
jgi:hypothetical protein